MSRELKILALFHRGQNVVRRLRYSRIDTALPKLTHWMMLDGRVGDVIEVVHAVTGLQIGTIKMSAKGQLVSKYLWDR